MPSQTPQSSKGRRRQTTPGRDRPRQHAIALLAPAPRRRTRPEEGGRTIRQSGRKSTRAERGGRTEGAASARTGVTRDRLYAETDIDDRDVVLVDTGGFEATPDGAMEAGINRQCLAGIEQADVVLFVVDGRVPPTNGDMDTVKLLRRSGKPAVLVANKIDSERLELESQEVYSLGMDRVVCVSALHGRGVSDLEDQILELLPEKVEIEKEPEEYDENLCKVAIIGRPNAGKSSLVNRLLGEDRLLTLDEPGTTRDPVDTYFEVSR